ncbi:MAG: Ig-like domain-containing protein [Saprospiraceae bacterium]|nr:Ig-like domain-containing protein [Saprospiraceae bacterium]
MDDTQNGFAHGCSLGSILEQPKMKLTFSLNTEVFSALYKGLVLCIVVVFTTAITYTEGHGQCSGTIYDSGGSGGNYSNFDNITTTLDAGANKLMEISFTSFNLESGYDYLRIYDGPTTSSTLIGTYTGTSLPPDITSSGQYLTINFQADYTVTRPGYSIDLSCIDIPPVPECLAIAQNNNGNLYSWTGSPAGSSFMGSLGATEIETMALSFDGQTIYTANAGDFGTVNSVTGNFNSIGPIGDADGALGTITLDDVDGMAINPTNGYIMAVHRRSSDNDLFFVINPGTGTVEKNYFGPGIDYREIVGALQDMDDIAFHPVTNELFGVSTVSNSTTFDQIVLIDQYYGTVTPISNLPTCDIEGLTFNDAGVLYGSSGFEECAPYTDNTIWEIDYSTTTGSVTAIVTLPEADVEALVCFVSAEEPCNDVASGGRIGSYQSICAGDDVAPFTNVESATQGSGGTIEYKWFYSTTSCIAPLNNDPAWIEIPGETGETYDHGVLYETTCFVRAAKTQGCPVYIKNSNVITVDVSQCACPSPTTVSYSISAGDDDVEEREDSTMYLNSTDIEMAFDASSQTIGLRFNNVNVPDIANIQSARLVFKADETTSDPTTLTIEGELTGNSQPFTAVDQNLTSRNRTASSTTWSDIEPWTAGNMYTSVYFTDVIQEIIDQGTWSSGNSLSIIITGTGKRVAEAFDKSSSTPIELIIEFCDEEICDNGVDDDGDGYADSFDPDCPLYAPFDCDKSLYQSLSPDNGATYLLDEISTDPISFNNVYDLSINGMTASGFNSMAFNPVDRFIYGLNPLKTGNYELYRINNIGAIQYLGNVTGLSGTNDAGCMSSNGSYYVSGASDRLYEININTLTATEIANLGFASNDMAINPVDNLIYAWNSDANRLYTINPINGASTAIGSSNSQYAIFGSMFFNEQGDLLAYGDDTNVSGTGQETLVQISTITGSVTPIGVGPEASENDGCSCAFGVGFTKASSEIAVEPGDSFTYTFTIYNRTGQTITNITFEDILPTGLTFASNPYNVTGLSLGSPSIIGSGTANFVISNIPPGELNSFDIDLNVPVDYCDDISNQASLTNIASEFGGQIVSDDPATVDINDPTITLVGNCEEYWLESECEDVGANWNVVVDSTASRYNYATINPGFNSLSTPPSGVDDRIRFNVTITNPGNYNIFGRVFAPGSNDDSFWVRANGGTWYKWNSLSSFASGGWTWGQVYDSDNGSTVVTFPLVAGANTIDFAYREDGTRLDKIKVGLSDEMPTGEGGISQNCPEICDNGEDDDGDGLTDCEDDDCSGEVLCQGPCDPGKLFVERWFGISGSVVSDLTSHPNYPDSPDELDYITLFQGPNNYANDYGTRIRGFIIPSESGTFTFNVTGDDNTILYLSTDVNDTNKSEIASVTGWSGVTEHNKYAVQTSQEIELRAGVWYYVEVLVKEGTGGDHFQVYWRTPSAPSTWNIIPALNIAPYICPEICDNGDDDDGDGLTDCLDPDCENGVNVFITSADSEICLGETAILNAQSSGSPGFLTYTWSGGGGTDQTASVSPLTTTTYVVTVTNSSGCTATDQLQVIVNLPPSASASNDGDVTCADPSVQLTASPAGLSYAWSGGGSNQTKDVTVPGVYTVTVTDANGCTDTASTTVGDDTAPPNADAGADQAICIGESALLNATGGVTYEWEDGSTMNTRNVTPIVTSEYIVTVTGPNGCTDIDTVRVVVNALPNVSIVKDGDIQCDNASVQLSAVPSGLSYIWSTTETTETISVTASGIYDVTVTDGNGCVNTAQITVDEYLTPTTIFCERYRIREYDVWGGWINFTGVCEIEICEEDGLSDIQIDGGPNLNTGWVWTDEDNNIDGEVDEIVTFQDIDVNDAGTYTGVYTNEYGCVSTLNINVIVNANPIASASNDGPITCNLPNVTITALPSGMRYNWSDGGTDQIKIVSSTGVYSVTVTDPNGCTSTTSTTVTDDLTPPEADAGLAEAICEGESANLTATGGVSYAWSNGINTASQSVSPLTTTTYTVTVTAANGCTDVDNVIITVNPLPTAAASNNGPITCNLPNVTLTALPAGMSYAWSGGGTAQTKSVNTTGIYTVTVTDSNGCTSTASTTVTDDLTPPVADAGLDEAICEGESANLLASGGISYAWSNGSNTASQTVSPLSTTTYTVTVTAANGCTDVDSVIITVHPLPAAAASNNGPITCNLPNVTLTALPAGMSYAWSGGGMAQTKSVNTTGVYTVTVTDSNGCTSTASTTVTDDLTPPVPDAGSDQEICDGESANLTATGGISYAWSNGINTASQTVSPVATTTYTVTVTAANGCTADDNVTITVNPLPTASAANDGPITCSLPNVTLSALPLGMVYSWSSGGSGQTTTVSTSGTYMVTVTDTNGCTSTASTVVTDDLTSPTADAGSDVLICEGISTDLTASGGISYEWSNSAGSTATVTVSPVVTTTYTVTVTAANGCQDVDDVTVVVDPKPIVNVTGSDTICVQTTTTLSPTTGGTWQSSDNSIAIVSSSGVVYGLSPGLATFTFTSAATGCPSDATEAIRITEDLSVAIDFVGGICINDDSQLSANVTGGTMDFTYNWSGPYGFTGSSQVVDIFMSGNYYVTVTDVAGCQDATSAYVYEAYDPFIFTLNTEICEDEEITLSVNSSTAVSYQWGANAGNATTQAVTVTPGLPSEDYYVTVTNNLGCTTEAYVHIDVKPKTAVNISGGDEICIGETTQLSPSTGGIWTSSNSSIAGITNDGIVTGLSPGTVTFIFLDSSSDCESDPTLPVTVLDRPVVNITGPDALCEGETTTVSPSSGGIWTSNDPSIATVNNNGIVTAISAGTTTFEFVDSITGCTSLATTEITVYPIYTTSFTGPDSICEGNQTYLAPTSGGTWATSNPSIATVSNIGVVTALTPGTVTFTFTSDYSCVSGATTPLTILPKDIISISGDTEVCEDETIVLSASSAGGSWSSSNNSIATVSAIGEVTGIAAGNVVITYTHDPNKCEIDPTYPITVLEKPTVVLDGPAEICSGEVSHVSASSSGGFWNSSDETVAIVSVDGTVVGLSAGTATFTYTASNSCESNSSLTLTVNPAIDVDIDFLGSVCLEDNTQLLAAITGGVPTYTYSWSGPGGFMSTEDTIDVVLSGLYNVLVTDGAGCSSNKTAYVYESYDPFIFTLDTEICEGEDITLSVNGSSGGTYQWGANAGSATTQSVTVTPPIPGDTYYVTITSPEGCTTVANAVIDVEALPNVSVTGADSICIGATTTLSPTTGGLWTSSNYSVASVTNSGVVTGLAPGGVTFTFRDTSTGCYSAPTTTIAVNANENIIISGDNDICVGSPETLTASVVGGTWSSGNTGIASISPLGVVTPVAAGSTQIYYTPQSGMCYDVASRSITVNNLPAVNINGPSTICEGEITYLVPSSGGEWVSDNPSVATVSNIGIVTGVSGGTASFTFTSDAGCVQALATHITIVPEPVVNISGPSSICIDETTNLTPTTGGVWISSNTVVATVNSSGLVIGKNPGTAQFTFVEFTNGCTSSDLIEVTVNPVPTITGLGDNNLCIGETTTISPTTGGTWISSNTAVATINTSGIITAVGAGAASFIYVDNATGCESVSSGSLTVEGNPTINVNGSTELCVGETSSMLPSSGGIWSTSDISIATISNDGTVTAVSAGDVTFTFTSNTTGCTSNQSDVFTVNNPTSASITGSSSMCIGTSMTLTGTEIGTWESSDVNIASVNNSGLVSANAPGVVTITLNTFASCITNPTFDVQVDPDPNPVFTGPQFLCIGSTTTLSPTTGGTWTSNDTTVATVDNLGNVQSISSGVVGFVFTDSSTGCTANTSNLLTVYSEPIISISGDDEICIGATTNMLPSSGGQWISSDVSIATIDPSGVVTGISEGNVTFTYIENSTSCVSEVSDIVTILPKPVASITGPNQLCIGSSSSLAPTTGGSWISSNGAAASVTDEGLVTAVGPGIARFTFISNDGCASTQTAPIVVYGVPSVSIDGPSDLCEGDGVQMLPSSGGTWTSSDNSVATIANNGWVSTISVGTATFTFTDTTTGCVSVASDVLTVNAQPITAINGPSTICIGSTTNFTPSAGGIWTSINPSIATIGNNGEVTGVASGTARFVFTDLITGCVSDTSSIITVTSEATPVFTGSEVICIGDTTYITPDSNGTWESTNTNVATITNSGLIVGVGQGTAKFRYTNSTTGCISNLSSSLTVNAPSTVLVDGDDLICLGSTTTLSPSNGGTWVSLNPSIATVDNSGLVTGVGLGTAYFTFTDSITGCTTDGSLNIDVEDASPVSILGESDICIGYTVTLTPSTGGFWESSNEDIASISNSGIVTGRAPGVVTFTFTDLSSNCVSINVSDPITVTSCKNHDFNVAIVNEEIFGNVSTNDNYPQVVYYSSFPQLISKPDASIVDFTINTDGSYSFTGSKPGNYRYNVPICLDENDNGCPTSLIEFTLVQNQYSTGNPVTNLDIATIFGVEDAGKSSSAPGTFEIQTTNNDICVYTLGCDMDWNTAWIDDVTFNGFSEIKPNGIIEYTPEAGFIGFDTIYYGMCADGYANCNTSMQIVTINHSSAANSVIASDDFKFTLRGSSVTGNLLLNDSDAEGDSISITPQGSFMAPITTVAGEYYIDALGDFTFTPNETFSGHTEIIYQICDNNPDQACMNATLHLLVFDDISVELRAYIQGALMQNGGAISSTGKPLMRDDLRVSPFTGENYIPILDPYTISADPFISTPSKFNKIGPGLLPENQVVTDSSGVFGVNGENAIVDWIHVELRSKEDSTVPIATRSGLLQRDGDIVDLDGVSNLRFNSVNVDSFYVVVKHRSHLGVMSELVSHTDMIDFTDPTYPVFNFGVKGLSDFTGLSQNINVINGYSALWAGDFDSNGKVKFTNPGDDQNVLFIDVLFTSPSFLINYDQAYGYLTGDFNMNSKSKYTNPSDDLNYLFSQILLYPLNSSFLSNYNSLIEQIPEEE